MYNIGVALMYPYSGNSTTGLCSISMEKNILGEMKKHIYIHPLTFEILNCVPALVLTPQNYSYETMHA